MRLLFIRDISPWLKPGASSSHEEAFPASLATACLALATAGLTLPPQAATESPSVRMFFAALVSRSCTTPHAGHTHSRMSSGSESSTSLQALQGFRDRYQPSIF